MYSSIAWVMAASEWPTFFFSTDDCFIYDFFFSTLPSATFAIASSCDLEQGQQNNKQE
jgi:hypothetical protein